MLKHATISRTSRAQQALQLQKNCQLQSGQQQQKQSDDTGKQTTCDELIARSQSDQERTQNHDPNNNHSPSPQPPASPASILSTPNSNRLLPLQTPTSLLNSPSSSSPRRALFSPNQHQQSPSSKSVCSNTSNATRHCGSESMIKVFAQTLSQDVEYITLHVNAQTRSQQIIKSLLRKFRLKHRDPNLFYLTLERWIRKDGLKSKYAILLSDEACPLQMQQCCSNPPHNDIKFTLQMKAGALVKIYCSDVAPNSRYKCLSLSTQTTVEETIELMLHCLNLVNQSNNSNHNTATNVSTNTPTTTNTILNHFHHHHPRLSGSPSSTGSVASNSSSSSSSGIESEPSFNHHHNHQQHIELSNHCPTNAPLTKTKLDSDSRASSVTSISSTSNISNISTSITDQYCMVIECKDTSFERILEPDEYLVDVYQNLLVEAKAQSVEEVANGNSSIASSINDLAGSNRQQTCLDQWFFIKLKRRDDFGHSQTIKFANPRLNVPLPPIPLSISQFNNSNNLQHIVSTTQIEVSGRSNNNTSTSDVSISVSSLVCSSGELGHQIKQLNSNSAKLPPPPQFIVLPPVRPRRRNLSNASSTFGRPLTNNTRRRYDPAQLAEDLHKLDFREAEQVLKAPQKDIDVANTNETSVCDSVAQPIEQQTLPSKTDTTITS